MPMAPKQVISVGDTLLAVDGERWSREEEGTLQQRISSKSGARTRCHSTHMHTRT